jgi:CRISPR-associated protein Csm4
VSGTVWGHLAWAVRYLDGERAFLDWLASQEHNPWLVSSAMPAGNLPRPLLVGGVAPDRGATLKELERWKKARKAGFIPEDLFLRERHALSGKKLVKSLQATFVDADGKDPEESFEGTRVALAHNRIDRVTARTPDQGGLYFSDASLFHPASRLQLFMATPEPCKQRLSSLFDYVGTNGFGADASSGAGSMRFSVQKENDLFADGYTSAMSLSHGVLTENMESPLYRQHVHFGRLGGHLAKGALSPFKYPILMSRPGATFIPGDEGPYGALLDRVHHDPALAGIRHHAFHLTIGFTEEPA